VSERATEKSEPVTDFRSDRMPSPEGKGLARRAWEAYAAQVERVAGPAIQPLARKAAQAVAVPVLLDLMGFWLAWHLEGGFEGLQEMGMSRASIYRRVSLFRRTMGVHPDEYMPAGIALDIAAYQASKPEV
jgi:hypothetical protein